MLEQNGDNLAIDTVQSTGLEFYDFPKPFDPDVFESKPDIEEMVWKKFLKDYQPTSPKDIVPHDHMLVGTALNRYITKEEAEGLNNRTKMLFVLAFVAWTDGTGRHELQRCAFVPRTPTVELFATDCITHTGLQKKATH